MSLPVKFVDRDAASDAPASFEVTLACTVHRAPCTVPDGDGGRLDVDMGDWRAVTVPADGVRTVSGIPLGAECLVDGETITGGATNSDFGGPVLLDGADGTSSITVTNTFEGGPLNIIKNRVGVAALTHGAGPFTVEVTCTWSPDGELTPIDLPDDGIIILNGANGYRAELPVMPSGSECAVVETNAGGATATTMDPEDGVIDIVQPGFLVAAATVTITNVFDSSLLAFTGVEGAYVWLLAAFAFLLLLAGLVAIWVTNRRRREA